MSEITLRIPLEHLPLAEAIREEVARQLAGSRDVSPWLSAAEAAEYMRCPVSRVRKLTSTGDMPVHREGSRVLYRRDELETFIRDGGARSC